ncbi:hypothetical protein IIU_06591 [Bacillus cereus VD133]|uniref:Xylose isomerase-like TIM barrel domain-containing protein n=1 Tax=Bacillus cereus VD133 TaxID=1053233 RepID=A0A9W5PJX5_BACCE|nr:TIM barrel protein [Bacillus cereus]EOO24821.1 hypothetical protein IIU_06591 [Bacillus cereus VD133]
MKAKLTINLDEISSNLDTSFAFLKEMDLHTCELRMINKKNISVMNKNDIIEFSEKIKTNHITPVSIASPILKWSTNNCQETIIHDNFGIDPNVSDIEKEKMIDDVLEYADILAVDKIRIFSYLGKVNMPLDILFTDKLFKKLINSNHTFLIENEPVCTVYTKRHVKDLAHYITQNNIGNIKIWLDIANLIQIGEEIDEAFIANIAPCIGYIHVKDFIKNGDAITYVPVGEGMIHYERILSLLDKYIPDRQDITISIETHANAEENKYTYSKKSIIALRETLKKIDHKK